MSKISGNLSTVVPSTFLLSVLIAPAMSAGELSDPLDSLCLHALPIESTSTVRGFSGAGGLDRECFEIYVADPGVLRVDLSVPLTAEAEPRLDFLGQDCGGSEAGFANVERRATGNLIAVHGPGSYSFCVVMPDALLSLGAYKLETAFLGFSYVKTGEDPEEGEIVVDPSSTGEGEDPEEGEIVVDPARSPLPGSGFDLAELCRVGETDDHGNVFPCATALRLGHEVEGELENPWGDDVDVFSFRLREWQTVLIETSGSLGTVGALYGRDGQRLATGGARGARFRLVKTLGPGRYFVRVEGRGRVGGTYRLVVEVLGR